MDVPIPHNEAERIKALQRYQILDTSAEAGFNDIVYLASRICEVPIALISLIDTNRQWFKAKEGLEVCETHRDYAFCAHAILDDGLLVIPDAAQDERFKNNPLVTADPHIRFYAGAPLITPDDKRLGTLCVIDRKPRQLNEFQLTSLRMLAKQVVNELELRLHNSLLREKLKMIEQQKEDIRQMLEERNDLVEQLTESTTVRERLLSVMAHDLRSPLSTIQLLLSFLGTGNSPKDLARQQHNIQELSRMLDTTTHLLDNLLEWSVSRIRGKQDIEAVEVKSLSQEVIEAIIFNTSLKNNEIRNLIHEGTYVQADPSSLSLILRNLLTNANKFTQGGQILLVSSSNRNEVCLSVSDTGIGMNQEQLSKLFTWNKRTTRRGTANEKGSGMGLPMCVDMLTQMGGRISVESSVGKGTQLYIYLPKAESVASKTSIEAGKADA